MNESYVLISPLGYWVSVFTDLDERDYFSPESRGGHYQLVSNLADATVFTDDSALSAMLKASTTDGMVALTKIPVDVNEDKTTVLRCQIHTSLSIGPAAVNKMPMRFVEDAMQPQLPKRRQQTCVLAIGCFEIDSANRLVTVAGPGNNNQRVMRIYDYSQKQVAKQGRMEVMVRSAELWMLSAGITPTFYETVDVGETMYMLVTEYSKAE